MERNLIEIYKGPDNSVALVVRKGEKIILKELIYAEQAKELAMTLLEVTNETAQEKASPPLLN